MHSLIISLLFVSSIEINMLHSHRFDVLLRFTTAQIKQLAPVVLHAVRIKREYDTC